MTRSAQRTSGQLDQMAKFTRSPHGVVQQWERPPQDQFKVKHVIPD